MRRCTEKNTEKAARSHLEIAGDVAAFIESAGVPKKDRRVLEHPVVLKVQD